MDENKENDERVKFQARLPKGLHRWLKITSAESGEGMNDILVGALQHHRETLEGLWIDRPEGTRS